jgi:transposase
VPSSPLSSPIKKDSLSRHARHRDDKKANVFLDNINHLFHFEREYDRKMTTDKECTRQRQGLPVMKAMINLRANLLQKSKSEEE